MRTRDDKSDQTLSGAIAARSTARRAWRADRNVASRPGRRLASIFSLLLAFTLAGASFATRAGTNVSGPITANTTWSVAGAPYTVTGDVTVNGGAVLTVEAGVVVYMNAGTNLVVGNGSLSVIGTANAPIVVTSYRDIANPSPAPAPGDWGQLKFLSGTLAGTSLNYVQIKYGSGVAMTAASPALNNVSILNHNAPAISIDLQSSPVGTGLAATGNTLNGILVPAGDITGNVNWGLTGIPYVVAQGIVGVGAPPISISPSNLSLNANTTGTLHVAVANAAPSGGIALSVSSSVPAAATVPATVTVPQGATTVDVTVTAVASGTSTITVSGTGLGSATATVQVNSAPALTLSPGIANVSVGQTLPMTVTASSAAPAGGLAVALSSANTNFVTVPTPVTIAANQTTAGFNATGVAPGASTITARASGYTNGTATITAQPLALSVPANLLVAPGLTVGLTITLPAPAPAGGMTVNLLSANTVFASVPLSVSVPANAVSASVNVTGGLAGNTTITASATGYTSGVTNVAVSGITLDVQPSGTINIPQGVTQTYQIKLSTAAPAGGVTVNVVSNGTSTATVSPASVTIAQGQTFAATTIGVQGVATGNATLTLSSSGLNSKTVAVNVLGQGTLAFGRTAFTVGKTLMSGGGSDQINVTLLAGNTQFLTPVPVTVTLINPGATKVGVPTSVTILANTDSADFTVSGLDVTAAPVALDASGAGYAAPATKLNVTVVNPQFEFNALTCCRVVGEGRRDDFYLKWYVPSTTNSPYQASASTTTINLAVTDQNPPGIVGGFHDSAAGGSPITQVTIFGGAGNYASTTAYVDDATVPGTYTITVNVPGLVTQTSPATTVVTPALQISPPSIIVGKGLFTPPLLLYRTAFGDNFYSPATPVTVSLVSSDPTKATVPATVTIPAFQSSATFTVTGVDLTAATVTVDVRAAGYTPPATRLGVNVVTPQIGFGNLDNSRTTSSARDDFYVSWNVPGSAYQSQFSVADQNVALSITDQNPAGIVSAIYDSLTGGNAVSQVTIPAGQNSSSATPRFVGQPTVAGTYTVTGSAGGASTASFVQTVIGLQLPASITVGAGLTSAPGYVRVLRNVASSTALTVSLSCALSSICSVPASVTIPAFATSASIPLTGGVQGTATLVATNACCTSVSASVTVEAPRFFPNTPVVTTRVGGMVSFQLLLGSSTGIAETSATDIVVSLSNSPPLGVASMPPTVTIPAGSTSATVVVLGVSTGGTLFQATSPGFPTVPIFVQVTP